ncbi:MAG: PD-(D/E)XK nuclease-like domain-containing protein [Candidatus Shapirobacteria bacterium]|jgi:hypothetical protein
MEIKLIENLSNEEYHNGKEYKDYWSSSNIKEYLNSPREAYYQKFVAEHESKDAFMFGSQLHDYMASKHIKGQPFTWNVFEPPKNNKGEYFGKTSQAYKDALKSVNNGIHPKDLEIIKDIWSMILESQYAWYFQKEILKKGTVEESIFINGIHKYKIRKDVDTGNEILDYKTIKKEDFYHYRNNVITSQKYDISAAMYQYFEHQRTGIWKPFKIIWIMKDPPYDILIQDISCYCFENIGNNNVIPNSGANVFLKLKDQHEACQMANCWPGLANQFDAYNGVRIDTTMPRFERGFEQFEINIDNF